MLAMRRIIKLFKLIKRKKKLDYKILIIFILYNYRTVRIYGHYTLIKKDKIILY